MSQGKLSSWDEVLKKPQCGHWWPRDLTQWPCFFLKTWQGISALRLILITLIFYSYIYSKYYGSYLVGRYYCPFSTLFFLFMSSYIHNPWCWVCCGLCIKEYAFKNQKWSKSFSCYFFNAGASSANHMASWGWQRWWRLFHWNQVPHVRLSTTVHN